MDSTDHLQNGQNNGSSPVTSTSSNNVSVGNSENLTNESYKGVSTIINPPPPPLPGVFVFDPPGHQLNTVDPSFPQSVTYSESVPVTYNNSSNVNTNTGIFQCQNIDIYDYPLPHEEKGLKTLQPVLQGNVDDILPSDGSVYQSLQPVSHNMFDISSDSNTKVYQQLKSPSENDYRLNEESSSGGKYFQPLHPLDVESRFQLNEEPKVYQQLKPVIPSGETKSFLHLKPVAPTIDAPQYVNSKLYQQLSQPSTRGSRIGNHSDSKLYHQLRPVTVSDFELRPSRSDVIPKHAYQNAPITTSPNRLNPYFHTNNAEQIQNKTNFQKLTSSSGMSHSPQSRSASYNLEEGLMQKTTQGPFPLNKPKVYLELRQPNLRQSDATGSYQTGCNEGNSNYSGLSPKLNNSHPISPVIRNNPYLVESQPRTCSKRPPNIHTNEINKSPFKLPSLHEFNLPNHSTSNNYRLPKILGPNEYNDPQSIAQSEGIKPTVGNSVKTSLESKLLSSIAKPFTDSPPKPNSPFGKLSLPKSPVCYGDSNAKSESSYHSAGSVENSQKQFNKSVGGSVSSSSSSSVNQLTETIESNLSSSHEFSSSTSNTTGKNGNALRNDISPNNAIILKSLPRNLNSKRHTDKLLATDSVIYQNKPLTTKENECTYSTCEGNHILKDKKSKILSSTNLQFYSGSLNSGFNTNPSEGEHNSTESTSIANFTEMVEASKKIVQSNNMISNYSQQQNKVTLEVAKPKYTVNPEHYSLETNVSQIDDLCLPSKPLASVKYMNPDFHQAIIPDLNEAHQKLNQYKKDHASSNPISAKPNLDFRNNYKSLHTGKRDHDTDSKAQFIERDTTFIHKNKDNNDVKSISLLPKVMNHQTSNFVAKKFGKGESSQSNGSPPSIDSIIESVKESPHDYEDFHSKTQYKNNNLKSEESLIHLYNQRAVKPIKRKRGRPRKIIDPSNILLDNSISFIKSNLGLDSRIKRKRGRPRKVIDQSNVAPDVNLSFMKPDVGFDYRIKKKRGRPRKIIDQSNFILDTNISVIKSHTERHVQIKRKRGRPRKNPIHSIASDENTNISFIERSNFDASTCKRKRGRPRKYFRQENENNSSSSLLLSNDGSIILQKRKYTKRFNKDSFGDGTSAFLKRSKRKYVKRKRFPVELGFDDNQATYNNSLSTPELTEEFSDPLEEGLISDDDGEVVFLGFDMDNNDDEDDTILGFDLSPSGDDQDQFNLILGQLDTDCMTVECDPRSLLQAAPNTTTCSQCHKNFPSHQDLAHHMQLHAEAIKSSNPSHSYKCSECFRGFMKSGQLEQHVKSVHGGGKKYNCPVCLKYFKTKHYVKKHVETIHSDHQDMTSKIMFFCSDCPLTFTNEQLLNAHESKAHKKILHQCNTCLKHFEKLSNLKHHMKIHEDCGDSYHCAYCNQNFASRALLRSHWLTHSDLKPFRCNICNSTFTSGTSLKRHKFTHSKEKLFRCEICQRSFSLLNTLKTHLLIHTGARRFECKLCHKKFNRRDVLNAHQWVHTGEKKFQCDICLERFRWRHAVRSHKLIYHSTEKPYVCDICGKKFSHPNSFKKHAQVHAEKTFFCQICLKGFSRPSTLKSHILIHTDLKPYFCDVCNRGFRSKSHLRNHFLVHTKEKPWLCKFCNKTFKDRNQLQRHKRDVHCKRFYKQVLPFLPECLKTVKNFEIMCEPQNVLINNEDEGTACMTSPGAVDDSQMDNDIISLSLDNSFSTDSKENIKMDPSEY